MLLTGYLLAGEKQHLSCMPFPDVRAALWGVEVASIGTDTPCLVFGGQGRGVPRRTYGGNGTAVEDWPLPHWLTLEMGIAHVFAGLLRCVAWLHFFSSPVFVTFAKVAQSSHKLWHSCLPVPSASFQRFASFCRQPFGFCCQRFGRVLFLRLGTPPLVVCFCGRITIGHGLTTVDWGRTHLLTTR